ncbi:ornithine cyclodeaminase family protein [Steroidobacter sp. S1-65]|uniref:Ornithine cyclodeaminase family protein n=1 Tax=Steroidobacter gossypii TaxID=2805490 RepID=A0ABS1X4J7_9GAMM|nr:ornithine cyclodeaminase family protein [Steroidobacter gossypii]MBM0108140.1 ornithine cyclodeaminase family protein [Steroidobacter gossypii]
MSHTTSTELLVISGADVRRLLPMRDCIPVVESAMREVSRGGAQLPLRIGCIPPGTQNIMAVMPGYLDEPASMGAKVIAVYPSNAQRGLSSHMGVVVLFEPREGVPLAVIDAAAITGLRTAAATAVATKALAPERSGDLTIIGTGEQAAAHLLSISLVRNLRSIRLWGRSADKARAFAEREALPGQPRIEVCESIRDAVADADIVCTTTGAREPIVEGAWIAPGAHVNLVGASSAAAREVDNALVLRSSFFVDYRGSALAQAGELLGAMGANAAGHIRGEIGEVLNGSVPGRTAEDEITVYKSLGIAAQDLAAAHAIYQRARQSGAGVRAAL